LAIQKAIGSQMQKFYLRFKDMEIVWELTEAKVQEEPIESPPAELFSHLTADSLLQRITIWTMTKGGPEAVEPVVYLPAYSVGTILSHFIIRYLKTPHLR
jgi:hypothetical protein